METEYFEIDTFYDLKHSFVENDHITKYYKYLGKLNSKQLYFEKDKEGNLVEMLSGRVFNKIDNTYINSETGLYIYQPKSISVKNLALNIVNISSEAVDYFFSKVSNIKKTNDKIKQLKNIISTGWF